MRGPRGVLGRVLIVKGVGLLLMGVSWLITTTESRLQGVWWLAGPYTDTGIGIGWTVAGVLAIIGGLFNHRRGLETAGVAAAVVWPGAVAAIFAIAWIWGDAPNGWVTVISYLIWSVVVAVVAADPGREPAPSKEILE